MEEEFEVSLCYTIVRHHPQNKQTSKQINAPLLKDESVSGEACGDRDSDFLSALEIHPHLKNLLRGYVSAMVSKEIQLPLTVEERNVVCMKLIECSKNVTA